MLDSLLFWAVLVWMILLLIAGFYAVRALMREDPEDAADAQPASHPADGPASRSRGDPPPSDP